MHRHFDKFPYLLIEVIEHFYVNLEVSKAIEKPGHEKSSADSFAIEHAEVFWDVRQYLQDNLVIPYQNPSKQNDWFGVNVVIDKYGIHHCIVLHLFTFTSRPWYKIEYFSRC